jgi:hypothetical protein
MLYYTLDGWQPIKGVVYLWGHRLMVRTRVFKTHKTGSIPVAPTYRKRGREADGNRLKIGQTLGSREFESPRFRTLQLNNNLSHTNK